MLQRTRKALLAASAVVALASMTVYGILENTYVNYPKAPEQSSGRVVSHEVKSITVYITERQSEVIHWVTWTLLTIRRFGFGWSVSESEVAVTIEQVSRKHFCKLLRCDVDGACKQC